MTIKFECYLFQIGSFLLLNMWLVIISVQFGETKSRESKLMSEERRLAHISNSSISTKSSMDSVGAWESLLEGVGSLILKIKDAFCGLIKKNKQTNKRKRKRHTDQVI